MMINDDDNDGTMMNVRPIAQSEPAATAAKTPTWKWFDNYISKK